MVVHLLSTQDNLHANIAPSVFFCFNKGQFMAHILHGKKSSVGCAIWRRISNKLGNNSLFDIYGGPEKGLLGW